jgi:Tfp pilus assembly PilM family ATPase
MSPDLTSFIRGGRTRLGDVVGVDIGSSGTKAVRLRTVEGAIRMTAVAHLPRLPFPTADAPAAGGGTALVLPRELRARHVALALSHPEAVTKLLAVPRAADKLADFAFAGLLGLANPDAHRIGVEIESSSHNETVVLAAALPERIVRWALGLFPAGTPIPCSVEIAGLAALNAIAYSLRDKPDDNAVMAIDIGAQTSTVGILVRNELALVRQFQIGTSAVLARVAETLGMDEETARSVLTDGVIDASDAVHSALDPLVRQLVLGRDFVARRRNCRIGSIYLTGGLLSAPFWRQQLATMLGIEAFDWNPLLIVPSGPGTIDPALTTAAGCFAAAMGTALAAWEAP